MELRFNTFSHCHDDVKFYISILKNLGYRAPPQQNKNETRAFKKNRFERDLAPMSILTPVDNGSSLNKLITLKIIALAIITLILETSVLVV
jgi:hypothetical protein